MNKLFIYNYISGLSDRKKWIIVFTDSWDNDNEVFNKLVGYKTKNSANANAKLSIKPKRDSRDNIYEIIKDYDLIFNKYSLQLIVFGIKMENKDASALIKQLKRIRGFFLDFDNLNSLNDIFKTMGNVSDNINFPCEVYEADKTKNI